MNEANSLFPNAVEFSMHLNKLREERLIAKTEKPVSAVKRKSLTVSEKEEIFRKTGGYCHICGGVLSEKWEANHIVSRAHGGAHRIDNFLPAHVTCNRARWFYGAEEFQWIVKMGVFFRTQLEEQGNANALALAQVFVEYEQKKVARRKKQDALKVNAANADA